MGADGSSLRADSDDSASRLRNLRIENAITRRTKAQNTERPGGIFHCCAAFPNARKARDIPLPIAVSISKDWIASELQVHAGRKNEKNQFLLAVIHREMKFFLNYIRGGALGVISSKTGYLFIIGLEFVTMDPCWGTSTVLDDSLANRRLRLKYM